MRAFFDSLRGWVTCSLRWIAAWRASRLPAGEAGHFAVTGQPLFDADGAFGSDGGRCRDVADRIARTEHMIAAQSHIADLFESIQDALALFDADDRLVLFNQRYRELYGDTPELLQIGLPFEEGCRAAIARFYPARSTELEARAQRRLALHRSLPCSHEQQVADGRWFKVREVRTRDGGTLVAWTDISDEKRREEELHESMIRAEAANRAKSAFLANMSHELRTPLNAIIGFSEMMTREMLGPLHNERYAEYACDIHASGTHLLEIINEILEFSKAEAGRLSLNEEELDIAAVIAGALRLVREQAQQAGIGLHLKAPPGLPRLRADELRLRQIVLNLLSNAIKFTASGGRVELRVAADARQGCVIEVSDNGIGIAPEDLPRALQPFGQVDNFMTRRHPGTGLGLPLAKSLVELHGGTMSLVSAPGRGTTVTVRLPAGRLVFAAPALAAGGA